MYDINKVKELAGQMLALAAQMLHAVEVDELERRRIVDEAKKTQPAR